MICFHVLLTPRDASMAYAREECRRSRAAAPYEREVEESCRAARAGSSAAQVTWRVCIWINAREQAKARAREVRARATRHASCAAALPVEAPRLNESCCHIFTSDGHGDDACHFVFTFFFSHSILPMSFPSVFFTMSLSATFLAFFFSTVFFFSCLFYSSSCFIMFSFCFNIYQKEEENGAEAQKKI